VLKQHKHTNISINNYFSLAHNMSTMKNHGYTIRSYKILATQIETLKREFDITSEEFIKQFPPETKYILLNRNNILDQAISHYKARFTGQWQGQNSKHVNFNGPAIDSSRWHLEKGKNSLLEIISICGIQPLIINYESMEKDIVNTIKSIFKYLELEYSKSISLTTKFVRQRDSVSEDIKKQYISYLKKSQFERKFRWIGYKLLIELYKTSAFFRRKSKLYSRIISYIKNENISNNPNL